MVKFNPKLAKKKLHKLWSEIVRARDKTCVFCGTSESLHAHHAIVHAGRSNAVRYDTRNGLTLCAKHHLFGVHKAWSCEPYPHEAERKWSGIVDKRIPEEVQEELRQQSRGVFKMNKYNLELELERLKEEYNLVQ